jgi:hypothetical protein
MAGFIYGKVYKLNASNSWVALAGARVCINVCAPCTGCVCGSSATDGSYRIEAPTGTGVNLLCCHKDKFKDNTIVVEPTLVIGEGAYYGSYDFYMLKAPL